MWRCLYRPESGKILIFYLPFGRFLIMDRKSEILESAMMIIGEEGREKLTMDTLSKSLGIRKASLYHYFKGKEEIIRGAYEYYHKKMMRHAFQIDLKMNKDELLLKLYEHWMEIIKDDELFYFLRAISEEHYFDQGAKEEMRALELMIEGSLSVVLGIPDKGLWDIIKAIFFQSMESYLEDGDESYEAIRALSSYIASR